MTETNVTLTNSSGSLMAIFLLHCSKKNVFLEYSIRIHNFEKKNLKRKCPRVSIQCTCGNLPEVVDHIGHAEERQDKGTGPAVTLPDEVAAMGPSLAQPLLSNGSV